MKTEAVICHQLSLVVRLIDSVFGNEIMERNVRFHMNPRRDAPIARGGGTYLFLNAGDEDFDLEVYVYGYEIAKERMVISELDKKMPIREIYLLPNEFSVRRDNILTLRGIAPGTKAVEAVSLTEIDCCMKEYNARSQIMTVLNQHNVKLSSIYYGLLGKDRKEYVKFAIEEQLTNQTIQLKEALKTEFEMNQPIARVIFGKIEDNGQYLLKVPDGKKAEYLVRFTTGEETIFQHIDFHQVKL